MYSSLRKKVVLILMLGIFTGSIPATAAILPQPSSRPSAGRIYLVPLGATGIPSMMELQSYYRKKFGLTVESLPLLQLDGAVVDQNRRQLIAEELIALMRRGFRKQANEPGAIIIGITPYDMYIREKTWQFAFSLRQAGRFAVVSSARMNPASFKLPANDSLLRARVRKMVTKNIGIMYYKLPQNDNPKSVLYRSILGLEELDRAGEDF